MALQRHLATLMLALAGAVSVHWVVYRAFAVEGLGHGYLPVASSLILPAGLLSLCWFSVRSARDAFIGHELTTPALSAAIAAMFISQELVEQAVTRGTLSIEPALLVGVAVAVPAAMLLRRLVATVAELVREFISRPSRRFGAPGLSWYVRTAHTPVSRLVASPSLGRAPPSLS